MAKGTWRVLFLAVACLSAGLLLIAGCASQEDLREASIAQPNPGVSLAVEAEFEGAVRFVTRGADGGDAFPVLSLRGDWRTMGRQYGHLMSEDIEVFHGVVVDQLLISERGLKMSEVDAQAESVFEGQSDQARQFITGMADGGGFDLAKAKRVAAIVPLADMRPGCSSMAAWGAYTAGGPLVVGRNWDVGGEYPGYKKFLNVIYFQPPAPDTAFAVVDFTGSIGFQTGMSASGLFVDVQNGMHSESRVETDRPLPTLSLFEFMAEDPSMDAADRFFMSPDESPMIALVMNVADASEDRVYEWGTSATKRRTADGLIAATNHFIDSSWEGLTDVPEGAAGDWSRERLANLLAIGNARQGQFDADAMMVAFDIAYEEGGATFPDYTVYQVVAAPADRTMWIKAPGYSSWEKVDLREVAAAE